MNKKFYFLGLILLTGLTHLVFAQEQSNWVSISNEYVKISLDKKTGRYIVYDTVNNEDPPETAIIELPRDYLTKLSPMLEENSNLSPILGVEDNALNFATFNIDNTPVVFGSAVGRWIGSPVIDGKTIIYGWQIGEITIIQRLAIVTNIDTLFEDAVLISYDIRNNSTNNIRTIGTRLTIDPTANNNQDIPYFLPNNRIISTEFEAYTGSMPSYWIGSDITGALSPIGLKGFLKGPSIITPSELYITTMKKALQDVWKYEYNKRNRISQENTAIILIYDPMEIKPSECITVASTMIGQPTLMNTFSNNGLEARASTFTTQNTTPMDLDIWISNIGKEIFDTVELTLVVPENLEIYDNPVKQINDVGPIDRARPISWKIGTKENLGRSYDVFIRIQGFQNGDVASRFEVPMTLNLAENFKEQNTTALKKSADKALSNLTQNTPTPSLDSTNIIVIDQFMDGDTYGSSSERLTDIYNYLQTINTEDDSQIIQMLETERQLLKEIQETEHSINQVNEQYGILFGIYKRMYLDPLATDREHINIQGLEDNITELETKLKQQEAVYSNISNQFK